MQLETLREWMREFRIPSRWTGDYLKIIDTGCASPAFLRELKQRENFRDLLALILDTLLGGQRRFYETAKRLEINL